MNALEIGLLALFPAMLGPLPAEERTLTALLCSGDTTIEVEIPISDDTLPNEGAPCHGKGCHGASCRKKLDLKN